jgi:hypothetical protein
MLSFGVRVPQDVAIWRDDGVKNTHHILGSTPADDGEREKTHPWSCLRGASNGCSGLDSDPAMARSEKYSHVHRLNSSDQHSWRARLISSLENIQAFTNTIVSRPHYRSCADHPVGTSAQRATIQNCASRFWPAPALSVATVFLAVISQVPGTGMAVILPRKDWIGEILIPHR